MKKLIVYVLTYLFLVCNNTIAQEDSLITLMVKAGQAVESIENSIIKKALEKELRETLELSNEQDKIRKLKNFIAAVESVKTSDSTNRSKDFDIEKEIDVCNMLTKYACLLHDLEGTAFIHVRNELVNNLNVDGMSIEAKNLIRGLVLICEDTEKAAKGIQYIKEDDAKAKTNLGLKVGFRTSVQFIYQGGNALPLIAGAADLVYGVHRLNKTKNRQFEVVINAYKNHLNRFLFDVNAYKSELVANHGLHSSTFITKDEYQNFLKAVAEKDNENKIIRLKAIYDSCKALRESKYYEGKAYLALGNVENALKSFTLASSIKSPILQTDGFRSDVFVNISHCYRDMEKFLESIDACTKAIANNPKNKNAYHYRALSYIEINQLNKALEDINTAIGLHPENSVFYLTRAIIIDSLKNHQGALENLSLAFEKGLNDLRLLQSSKRIQKLLYSVEGKKLLTKKVAEQHDFASLNEKLWSLYNNNKSEEIDDFLIWCLSFSPNPMHINTVAAVCALKKNKYSATYFANKGTSVTQKRVQFLLQGYSPALVEYVIENEPNLTSIEYPNWNRLGDAKIYVSHENMGNWGGKDLITITLHSPKGVIYGLQLKIKCGDWQKSIYQPHWANEESINVKSPSGTFLGKEVSVEVFFKDFVTSLSFVHKCGSR